MLGSEIEIETPEGETRKVRVLWIREDRSRVMIDDDTNETFVQWGDGSIERMMVP